MRPAENVEKLIKRVRLKASAQMHERTLNDVLEAQEKSRKTKSAKLKPKVCRIIMKSKITKLAVTAAVILIGIFSITFLDRSTTPAFAEIVENMLSQKWLYMFEEDRKEGRITGEYWYNTVEQKVYGKSHDSKSYAFVLDINSQEIHEYLGNTITIIKPDHFDDYTDWLQQRMPMIGGLLSRHEREGADIVQRDALYYGKSALLYEIEMTLPDWDAFLRTDKYSWLVDKKTHLPIICEHTHLYGRDYNGTYKGSVIDSERYVFAYSDSGPTDIYDLDVPVDANIVDERPSPEIQQLIDNINKAKEKKYNSFAAVIVKEEWLNRLVIRDGRRIREERFELRINYSDWEPKKEQYLKAMGETFDSIYQWLGQTDIMLRQGIKIVDEQFSYRTNDWDIEDNVPVKMGRRSGNLDEFSSYCWRGRPGGQVVTTPYSAEHNLVCTLKGNWYYYYDTSKDYMCVRCETKEGRVHYEILEFAQTAAGMWYPTKIREGYYYQKAGTDELIPGSKLVYIYARDLNDELRSKLDPQTLPNFVEHRDLTRQIHNSLGE